MQTLVEWIVKLVALAVESRDGKSAHAAAIPARHHLIRAVHHPRVEPRPTVPGHAVRTLWALRLPCRREWAHELDERVDFRRATRGLAVQDARLEMEHAWLGRRQRRGHPGRLLLPHPLQARAACSPLLS